MMMENEAGVLYPETSVEMEKAFKVGDVVWLNSGGPKMTVVSISRVLEASLPATPRCLWINADGEPKEIRVPAACLRDSDPGVLAPADSVMGVPFEGLHQRIAGVFFDPDNTATSRILYESAAARGGAMTPAQRGAVEAEREIRRRATMRSAPPSSEGAPA